MQAIAVRHIRDPAAFVMASDNPPRMEALVNRTVRVNRRLQSMPIIATDDKDGKVVHSMELRLYAWRKKADEQQLGFLRLWVDFVLLAEADSLVFMQSGFSRIACYISLARARSGGQCHELQSNEQMLNGC